MVVLAAASVAVVAAVPAASARTRATPTVHSRVGISRTKSLGRGKIFSLASCTSSDSATVSCEVWDPVAPHTSIRLTCLAPATTTPVVLTVAYQNESTNAALTSSTINVYCKGPHLASMRAPHYRSGPVLRHSPPPYTVTNCSVDLTGAQCLWSGESIVRACTLAVTANTLPAVSDAVVTLASADPSLNGKQIDEPFRCR